MNIELNTIYNEDCMEGMKRIPDGSVDCIICDLPYGVLNKGNEHAQWDCPLPMDKLWAEYKRVTKDNAAIILFGQGMFTARLMMTNPKMWRYNLIYKKGNCTSGFLNARRMPLRNHEDIMVFYKRQPTYNPQMISESKSHERNRPSNKNSCYGISGERIKTLSNERFPLSVIDIPREFIVVHPTQKPVSLLKYLVLTYSNKGDTILDNCMGSGTTALACIDTGRNFIGFEKEKKYFDIAMNRIAQMRQQPKLDF